VEGFIDVIVSNKPLDEIVLPANGPYIVSVLDNPSVPVPTIVKRLLLSLPTAVIETLVPDTEPKAGFVPTLIAEAAASDEI
tara:strand:- start:136 stop:378 length:243 start_codon:yes stop_codon:yes gene_type:complete